MSNIISSATSLWSFVNHPIDNTIGFLGSIFISIAGTVMDIAARIFEYILESTVTSFGATIQSYGILDGIQIVWAAFRDLSNIVIIGMFVFVAISMIIGNMTYGTRRWVANIIIVAVLINFSLLFTELVVDASQLVSTQFYRGVLAAANTDTQINPTDQTNTGNQRGSIADAFLSKMGVKTFWDSKALVAAVSASGGSSWTHSIVLALFFSLTVSTLLIATTVVFLYGAYLLIARALLLVVLLATSSLAFAAWLIPKYGESGWNSWRDALLQNAVLAPLLMIFLWASFIILKSAPTGSMGRFLSDPNNISSTDATATIVVYLFTIGMLYMSIRISSSFSSKITGFSIATSALNVAGRFSGDVLGFGVRRGLRYSGVAERAENLGNKLTLRSGAPSADISGKITGVLAGLAGKALRGVPSASFNPARTPTALKETGAQIAKRYGFGTQGKGGIRAEDQRADAAAKKATEEANKRSEERMKVTEEERKKMMQEAFNSRPAADKNQYAQDNATLRQSLVEQKKAREQLELIKKQENTRALKPEEVVVKNKVEEQLKQETARIEKAHAAISEFEKSLREEVDGVKEEKKDGVVTREAKRGTADYLRMEKEEKELTTRFGDNAAFRAGFNSVRDKARKQRDVDKLLKGLKDAGSEEKSEGDKSGKSSGGTGGGTGGETKSK